MGITIYFKGKLKNREDINSLKDDLIDISNTLNWECDSMDEDWELPMTAKLVVKGLGFRINGHLPLKGVEIRLHPDCESLSFLFDREGNLTTPFSLIFISEGKLTLDKSYNSVKTQFAPPDIHISIIKLLEFLKNRYIPDLEVFDEGGYWERRDKSVLVKRISYLNDKMDILEQALSAVKIDELKHHTSSELAKLIDTKLRNML